MHLPTNQIHLIEDGEKFCECYLTQLTAALTKETMKWIANCHLVDQDRENPKALIQTFNKHIRKSTKFDSNSFGAFYDEGAPS
jgi:hypothetical protein